MATEQCYKCDVAQLADISNGKVSCIQFLFCIQPDFQHGPHSLEDFAKSLHMSQSFGLWV